MRITVHLLKECQGPTSSVSLRSARIRLFAMAILAFVAITPGVWTQVPPPGVLVGPTPAESLRNAVVATQDQAAVVESTAHTWARHASSGNYRAEHLGPDFATMRLQFQVLRERFNWMAYLALQSNRPYVNNAMAELNAGLNIISELLFFLDQQFAAGTLDHATIVRTCRAFEDAMREWEHELRRGSSLMGIAS
jgi:hypothetical protein